MWRSSMQPGCSVEPSHKSDLTFDVHRNTELSTVEVLNEAPTIKERGKGHGNHLGWFCFDACCTKNGERSYASRGTDFEPPYRISGVRCTAGTWSP